MPHTSVTLISSFARMFKFSATVHRSGIFKGVVGRLGLVDLKTMAAFWPVTHVIFDLDGLLLDTEKLYIYAGRKVCSKYNKEYTPELHVKVAGLHGKEACAIVVTELDLPISPEDYYAQLKEHYKTLFLSSELKPDSEPIYHQAQTNILAHFGKEYTNELRQKILGTVELDTGKIFVEELHLPITGSDFVKLQTEEITARMPNVLLKPGAERLICHLSDHGIPMAVATSSSREHIALKFQKHGDLFSLMKHVVSGSSDKEVKKGKPAPDIFLVCASKFDSNPPPEKILVFEDAPNGVVAACAAGMQVVMVPEDHVPEEKRKQATLVIPSLEKFQPELFGLPPFPC